MSAVSCQNVTNGIHDMYDIGVPGCVVSSSHEGVLNTRSVDHQTTGSESCCR
jgi:hypothetical protein